MDYLLQDIDDKSKPRNRRCSTLIPTNATYCTLVNNQLCCMILEFDRDSEKSQQECAWAISWRPASKISPPTRAHFPYLAGRLEDLRTNMVVCIRFFVPWPSQKRVCEKINRKRWKPPSARYRNMAQKSNCIRIVLSELIMRGAVQPSAASIPPPKGWT